MAITPKYQISGDVLPQLMSIAAASVTGTNAGTANTIGTIERDSTTLVLMNSLNQTVVVMYNDEPLVQLESTDSMLFLDLFKARSTPRYWRGDGVFKVYATGSGPSTGSLRVTLI